MRFRFQSQMESLHNELISMGTLCEKAISAAVKAFLEGDRGMVEQAIFYEREIDRAERDIEALCMKLLLQQQPVARDLRAISSALKMISDMERIGDQAADIAEIAPYIDTSALPAVSHIAEMAHAASKMVRDSAASFVKKDLNMAQGVIQYDDVVDSCFLSIREELIDLVRQSSDAAASALDLLMIAKYLERIGDHATNIAEWVEFSITGTHTNEE